MSFICNFIPEYLILTVVIPGLFTPRTLPPQLTQETQLLLKIRKIFHVLQMPAEEATVHLLFSFMKLNKHV